MPKNQSNERHFGTTLSGREAVVGVSRGTVAQNNRSPSPTTNYDDDVVMINNILIDWEQDDRGDKDKAYCNIMKSLFDDDPEDVNSWVYGP